MLLLSAGFHVHVDLAEAAADAASVRAAAAAGGVVVGGALGPDIGWRMCSPDDSAKPDSGRTDDHVVLAAAGSTDPSAVADCHTVGVMLGDLLGRPVTVSFISAAEPRLPDAIRTARDGAGGAGRVVVATYLLAPVTSPTWLPLPAVTCAADRCSSRTPHRPRNSSRSSSTATTLPPGPPRRPHRPCHSAEHRPGIRRHRGVTMTTADHPPHRDDGYRARWGQRAGPSPPAGPLDRRLGRRGHRPVGERRRCDRRPQPPLVDRCEFLGFVIWQLWSIVVVSLPAAGFRFDTAQTFWLISIPSLVGATLRFPYTFMVPRFGGRNWTMISAALLIIPAVGLAICVGNPNTPFSVMLLVAATAGLGGGNFASSMANITYFYPQRQKGFALGLNAAGGNLGAAVAQLVVPIAISIGAGVALQLPLAGWMWVPLIAVAVVGAALRMDNLSHAKADFAASLAAVKVSEMWLLAFLYIGTFGSFIGFSSVFPKLIADQFPSFSAFGVGSATLSLAFTGALIGSLARPLGGASPTGSAAAP